MDENLEEVHDTLTLFERNPSRDIPPVLEEYLRGVAKTGKTLFPWTRLKPLFLAKVEQVMEQFNRDVPFDHLPPVPNVQNTKYNEMHDRIIGAMEKYRGIPFTVQRICELVTEPRKHYTRCDKFLRGLEKTVTVVSTVDAFGRRIVSESTHLMVNGLDTNGFSRKTDLNDFTKGQPFGPMFQSGWANNNCTSMWPGPGMVDNGEQKLPSSVVVENSGANLNTNNPMNMPTASKLVSDSKTVDECPTASNSSTEVSTTGFSSLFNKKPQEDDQTDSSVGPSALSGAQVQEEREEGEIVPQKEDSGLVVKDSVPKPSEVESRSDVTSQEKKNEATTETEETSQNEEMAVGQERKNVPQEDTEAEASRGSPPAKKMRLEDEEETDEQQPSESSSSGEQSESESMSSQQGDTTEPFGFDIGSDNSPEQSSKSPTESTVETSWNKISQESTDTTDSAECVQKSPEAGDGEVSQSDVPTENTPTADTSTDQPPETAASTDTREEQEDQSAVSSSKDGQQDSSPDTDNGAESTDNQKPDSSADAKAKSEVESEVETTNVEAEEKETETCEETKTEQEESSSGERSASGETSEVSMAVSSETAVSENDSEVKDMDESQQQEMKQSEEAESSSGRDAMETETEAAMSTEERSETSSTEDMQSTTADEAEPMEQE